MSDILTETVTETLTDTLTEGPTDGLTGQSAAMGNDEVKPHDGNFDLRTEVHNIHTTHQTKVLANSDIVLYETYPGSSRELRNCPVAISSLPTAPFDVKFTEAITVGE